MGIFSKIKGKTSAFDLDWGEVTPDVYDEKKNESSYICAHDYLSEESIKYSQILITGRVLWYQKYLHEATHNSISIDISGQYEIADSLKKREEVVRGLENKILSSNNTLSLEVYTIG
ncbi:MAG: hypothetical protein JKY54_15380 [Flavobacteriales bacterium]|nr:hypothetical protein [Flavobacteriales bacterium]